jgi:hypothetical protein
VLGVFGCFFTNSDGKTSSLINSQRSCDGYYKIT